MTGGQGGSAAGGRSQGSDDGHPLQWPVPSPGTIEFHVLPNGCGVSMFRQFLSWANLCDAWERVADNRGAPGVDRVSIRRFARRWEENLRRLQELVRTRRYRPSRLRRIAIPKRGGGQRLLSIPTVADRILQRALLNVLEPRFDRHFLVCSHGYRPGRSVRTALADILRFRDYGATWVFDGDIDDCFPSLDHALLREFLAQEILDHRILALIDGWLRVGIHRRHPDRGIPLGMPLSPLFCNVYLHRLDRPLMQRRWALVRYADDFIVCCRTREQAERAREVVADLLARLHLRLEPTKTRITSFREGFEFLGIHFHGRSYSFLWQQKRFTVEGPTLGWLWGSVPNEYE